jgi:hypothetical protein
METIGTAIALSFTPVNVLFVALGIFVSYVTIAIPGMMVPGRKPGTIA